MTYDTLRKQSSKEPIIFCELNVEQCSLTYGQAPCTATGAANLKCFNTFATCQDRANYDGTVKPLRISEPSNNVPPDINTFPCITRVIPAPAVRKPGEGIGALASIKIDFQDFPWHDRDTDPYVTERTYNPEDQGTFWGKWLARNPYHEDREMSVIFGFIDKPWDPANFEIRKYLIDRIEGPDSNGRGSIYGKDPLKLTEKTRAQFPTPTDSELVNSINPNTTTFEVTNVAQFSANDYIVINEEAMQIGSVDVPLSLLVDVVRGVGLTDNVRHDPGDQIQRVGVFDFANCIDTARNILTIIAKIDPAYINNAAWDSVRDTWFSGFNVFLLVPEPKGADELLSSLMEQCGFDVYTNERTGLIEVKALAPATTNKVLNDQDNLLADKTNAWPEQDKRISEIWYYYDKDAFTEPDEPQYYRRVKVFSAGNVSKPPAPTPEYTTDKIRTIFGSWIQESGDLIVNTVAGRLINRHRDPPIKAKFSLEYKDNDIWVGSDFIFDSKTKQDFYGGVRRITMEVLKAREINGEFEYEALFTGNASTRLAPIGANGLGIDYSSADPQERIDNAFIADNSGLMSDQSAGYAIS